MSSPELTVVIGGNGAGKTTWCRQERNSLPKPFYNADSIAEGLGDANDPNLQRAARELVDQRIRSDLKARTTFGFESTYSGRSRPDIVRKAKQLGYRTYAIFLGTRTADINIARVRQRVSEGGHHVDESEIRRRWTAAWTNLVKTWEEFDTVRILDASGRRHIEIARKIGPQTTTIATLPIWARDLPRGAGPTQTPVPLSRSHQAGQATPAKARTPALAPSERAVDAVAARVPLPSERARRQAERENQHTGRDPGRGRDD